MTIKIPSMVPLAAKILFVIDVIFDEQKYAVDERDLEISLDTLLKENMVTRDELLKIINFLVREKCVSLENPYRHENIDQEMFMRKRNSIVLFPFYDALAAKKAVLLSNSPKIETSDQTRKGRKPIKYNAITTTFFYRSRSLKVSKNAKYASLCDFYYPHCPTLDKSLHWKEIYKSVLKQESASPIEDMEKVRGWVRALNRWAENPKQGIGKLLKFEKEHVYRIK